MYGENGLTATSWWWISMPRATAAIHTTNGVVNITAPYMRFTMRWPMERVIIELSKTKDVKVIKMEDDGEEEKTFRYS